MLSRLKSLICLFSIISIFSFWGLENFEDTIQETDSKVEFQAMNEDCVESSNLLNSIFSPLEFFSSDSDSLLIFGDVSTISVLHSIQQDSHELILQKHLISIPPPSFN